NADEQIADNRDDTSESQGRVVEKWFEKIRTHGLGEGGTHLGESTDIGDPHDRQDNKSHGQKDALNKVRQGYGKESADHRVEGRDNAADDNPGREIEIQHNFKEHTERHELRTDVHRLKQRHHKNRHH